MKKITVDRIEENIAVCETDNGDFIKIKLSELPEKTGEGSVIIVLSDGKYVVDNKAREKRIREMLSLQDSFFED